MEKISTILESNKADSIEVWPFEYCSGPDQGILEDRIKRLRWHLLGIT